MKHLHAVILAGGSGTSLWPLSTPSFPKQFLPMPNGKSMIQETLLASAAYFARTCTVRHWTQHGGHERITFPGIPVRTF